MGDTEKCNTDMIQRLHSSFKPISLNHQLDIPHFNPNFIRSSQYPQSSQPFSDCGKRIGVPPSHPNLIPPTSPYSQIPTTRQSGPENFNPGASHSRSMSQPNSFFSFDSLPPLSPSPFRESLSAQSDHDVSMEDRNNPSLPPAPFTRCNSTSPGSLRVVGESLPPRKSHKRSNSDIPNGYNSMGQNSLPLIPPRPLECSDGSKTTTFVKKEPSCERKGVGERESVDYLFSAYMNLDNIDALDSLEADDSKNGNENREDMESSRASATKTNCSDTEGESSSVNESGKNNTMNLVPSGEKRESVKRRAGGGDIAPTSRHYRSVSVDSCFMEKLSFGDESLKPPPSPGTLSRKVSPSNSVDENSSAALNIEFKNGEFTAAEMKKIMANDKLAEMAMADPKRVKRILANRQSAARSKERKMRYIVELEHKVQTLQNEATTLSAQLTLLQRDMIGLTNQNNELKFRLQAMEQQARLSEALNEAMNGEVQRLKLAIGETSHKESKLQSLNTEMFQQLNISKLRRLQSLPQQSQNDTLATK